MSNLYRIIRYGGLKDSLEFSAREMMTLLSLYSGEGKEVSTKLSNEIGMKYRTFLNKPTLSNSQVNLLNAIRKAFQFAISQPELKFSPQLPTIQQTINNALSWNNYNPQGVQNTFNGAQVPNVTLINNPVDQWPQNWVKITGLPLKKTQDVFENPFAKSLKSQLGNWVSINNDELLIRGTKQAWEKFINISRWYLANLSSFLDIDFLGTLPDEPDLKSDNEKAKEQKKINVAVHENVISIFFDKTTPYYIKDIGEIVDYIDTVLEMPISSYRIHWENGLLQFIAPANEAKRIDIATQLYILSNKLKDPQGFNYQSIDLNNAIKSVFEVSMKESQEEDRKRKKSNIMSDKTVANNLRKNLLSEPFIASRFGNVEGSSFEEKVKNIYSSNTKIDENKPYGPNNWVGPFGETTDENQQKMQLDGIKYFTSRKVTILADEPGSGKTAQAIVAADLVRDNNQKILVFTPNSLLSENWLGKKAKGPMFFCGHSKEQLVNVETKEELDEAINSPNIIWIIVKESTFTQGKKEADDLANAINKYSKSKVFASLIVDEVQQYKDPEGKAFTKMQQAISWDGIPFRFGLSGTPADNTPDDIFAQLRLLRHDVIRDTKGEKGGYSQNEEGFASQFLGGPELSKIVALSRDKVSNNTQEISDDWRQKCYSVLEWAKGVTPNGKENIANLFSQTFLRREKSEIRDIPLDDSQKIIVKNVPQPPEEMMKAVDWKSKISKFNALAKVSSTVEKAIALLKADPKRQIFIASKFVDVVDSIANGINKIAGEGTAFGIHGGIKDLDRRDELVQTFKAFDKAKTFNQPIRVLVYTLDTGAVGLNFSNCDTGILNDLDDNPSVNLQAQYRVHRIDSKKPVTIFFTQFDDTVNSPAANYDRSCYERIQQKKKINSEICKLMKKVRNAKNPQEKMSSANEFVVNTIENIILDIGFDKHTQDFFFKNIQKAINGETIEPLEKIEVNKKKDEFEQMGHALIPFLPKDYKEKIEQAQTVKDIDSILYDSKNWLNQTSSDVTSITGKSLEDLSKDEMVKALEQMSSPEYTSKQLLERMRRVYKMRYEKYDPTLEGFNEWLQEESPGLYNKITASNWYQKVKTASR